MKREMTVVPYDPMWKTQFEEIKSKLESVFAGIAVDILHFGSTAIVGMHAKPIIDVMILVDDVKLIDRYNEKMAEAGYVPKGEHGIAGRRYFQKFADDGVNHTVHIHCYERDNPHAIDELMFCEYLKINKKAFEAYRDIKLEAMEKFRYEPDAYASYKAKCIWDILTHAKGDQK